MTAFTFDGTMNGLLTAVFDAYSQIEQPETLLTEGDELPLFCERIYKVVTDEERARRVWTGLEERLPKEAMRMISVSWLSESRALNAPLFRYICKVFRQGDISRNFADPDVLAVTNTARRVLREQQRMKQFVRFQKAKDGTYLAVIAPDHNVLPLVTDHFQDRFCDQPWLIYDAKRHYGFYYDGTTDAVRVTFEDEAVVPFSLVDGKLNDDVLSSDDQLLQDLWRTYFKAICIRERLNPRKQLNDMPRRYWRYMTEKQAGKERKTVDESRKTMGKRERPELVQRPSGMMWNLWHGCHKKSEGCQHCYVYRRDGQHDIDSNEVRKTASFNLPVRRNRQGDWKVPPGTLMWTCFTSDFFIEEADEWRKEAWQMIHRRCDLHFFIVTKRPERILNCLPEDWAGGYGNVTICCTMENQRRADERLPLFRELPICHKAIICEPLLEAIDFRGGIGPWCEQVTVGGESGNDARVCDYDWVLSIREQCVADGVAFHFKQTGASFRKNGRLYNIPRNQQMAQAHKAAIDFNTPSASG